MLYIAIMLFVLVTVGVVGLAFANMPKDIVLSLFVWQTQPLPVGWLLLLAFLLGALMLYLITIGAAVDDRRELKELRARVAELENSMAAKNGEGIQGIYTIQPGQAMQPGQVGQVMQAEPSGQITQSDQSSMVPPAAPIVPIPGMPGPDISDMPTLH